MTAPLRFPIQTLLVPCLLGLLAGPVPAEGANGASGAEVEVEALLRRARAALESDLAAWAELSFRRRVVRERLDGDGEVSWRTEYLFRVRPAPDPPGGFDETLLSIDGARPSPREIEEHRRLGRFEKHYRAAVASELENPFGEDLPLAPLLFDQEHRRAGRETVDGIPCHRLLFDARGEVPEASSAEELKRATRGSLCLSVKGAHLVEAEVESVRPVRQGPIRLNRISIRFEGRPVRSAWVPRVFQVESDARLGPVHLRKRNRYEYTDYRRP
ncbi:MAG: hypothetical protein PVG07_12510 [Acidobacteriota bacterium]